MGVPQYGTHPIRCAGENCKWKGFETDLTKVDQCISGIKSQRNVCPKCGFNQHSFMTKEEISAWLGSEQAEKYPEYIPSESRPLFTFDITDHLDLPGLDMLEIWQINNGGVWCPVIQIPLTPTLLACVGTAFQPFFKLVLSGHKDRSMFEPDRPSE